MRPISARSRNPTRSGRSARGTVFGGGFDDRDAIEQRTGLVSRKDRRLAFFHDVFRAAHGMRRVDVDHMPGDKPVEQHAECGQVLLDGRRRNLGLQILDEGGDMKRLDAGKLIEISLSAPGGEAPGGVHVSPAGMIVIDLAGEEFQDALCGFRCGREERAGRRSDEGARISCARGGPRAAA